MGAQEWQQLPPLFIVLTKYYVTFTMLSLPDFLKTTFYIMSSLKRFVQEYLTSSKISNQNEYTYLCMAAATVSFLHNVSALSFGKCINIGTACIILISVNVLTY